MENPVEHLVKATVAKALADAGSAALDGALTQAPMLDALLNGEAVTLDVHIPPILLQLRKVGQ